MDGLETSRIHDVLADMDSSSAKGKSLHAGTDSSIVSWGNLSSTVPDEILLGCRRAGCPACVKLFWRGPIIVCNKFLNVKKFVSTSDIRFWLFPISDAYASFPAPWAI